MSSTFNWGPVLAEISAAITDYEANEPLPVGEPMSLADMASAIQSAKPDIDKIAAIIVAHPGAIRAADRILAAVEAQGVAWATGARKFILALPGGAAAVEKYIPDVISALSIFQLRFLWRGGPFQLRPCALS